MAVAVAVAVVSCCCMWPDGKAEAVAWFVVAADGCCVAVDAPLYVLLVLCYWLLLFVVVLCGCGCGCCCCCLTAKLRRRCGRLLFRFWSCCASTVDCCCWLLCCDCCVSTPVL